MPRGVSPDNDNHRNHVQLSDSRPLLRRKRQPSRPGGGNHIIPPQIDEGQKDEERKNKS